MLEAPQVNHVHLRLSDHNSQSYGAAALNQSRERRAPHLPFRRISVNYAPKILFPISTSQRSSVASAVSIESLPVCQSERRSSLDSLVSPLSPGSSFATQSRGRPSSSGSLGSIELGPKNRSSAVNARARRTSKPKSTFGASEPKTLKEVDRKRRKVMFELWETEISYVEGLDLIYSNFLAPLVDSLSSTNPLLSPENLTAIFSNFVDIWNLHLSFRSDLDKLFVRCAGSSGHPEALEPDINTPSLRQASASPVAVTNATPDFHDFMRVLLSHFPYLSMYNPFVTSFPHGISLLTTLSIPHRFNNSNSTVNGPKGFDAKFTAWLQSKEAEPVCRKLKLRDWMLTIIQRCPRYLLLIKDLMSCTSDKDRSYSALLEASALLAKITNTMNEALKTHAQIISLLSLQRNTQNLPFPLISPGRSLIKRSTLVKVDRGSDRRIRDVLLFSDVLVWVSRGGEREEWSSGFRFGFAGVESNRCTKQSPDANVPNSGRPMSNRICILGNGTPVSLQGRPRTMRTRSRSDADVLTASVAASRWQGIQVSPTISLLRSARRDETQEERWFYRGSVDILDIDVVMSPVVSSPEDECMFEVLSPRESFALYAETPDERDSWMETIRSAKTARMTSVQSTQPNTTLTSSASNKRVRRYLQALPHDPGDTIAPSSANNSRAKVEHFVPAIWIPDQKMEVCMRCQSRFGWRLRRHHCRLCGKVVCASCSSMTFFIHDPLHEDAAATPARSCNACYDTVFPVLDRRESGRPQVPRPDSKDVLSMFHPSASMPSLALTVAPDTNPLLPSVSSFGIFNIPSFLRSTPNITQRLSMLEVYSETSTIASSIHTNDTGVSSKHTSGSSDETHDPSVSDTDPEAWGSPPQSQPGNAVVFESPVEEGGQAGGLRQQSAGTSDQLYPTSRCSSFSDLLRVPEVQYSTEDFSLERMTPPILPADVTAPRSRADAPADPRCQIVNPSRKISISPFSPTGPQSSVQDTTVVTLTRSHGDRLRPFTLMLGGTIQAHAASEHREIPFNLVNPASAIIGSDSRAESAVIDRLASILGRHSCS